MVKLLLCLFGLLTSILISYGADLHWESHPGYRIAPLPIVPTANPGFALMPGASTGIQFTNELTFEAEALNQNLLNGSGLALGDYDNDGWCDIFLCNLNGSCALFRNLGEWRFTNVTAQVGLANTNWLARGAVFADVDGDGFLDLLITGSGKGARLFLNNGQGAFHESAQPELSAETGSTSLTLADIDGDGDLDLFVANYGENTIRSGLKLSTRNIGGKEQVVGRMRNRIKIVGGLVIELGEPAVLYRNDGHGRFTRASWTDGTFRDETGAALTGPPWDLGLTAVFRDLNQDGAPDLYVCNDFQTPDRIWINNGKGQFQAIPRESLRLISQFSMAADFADINHDGFDDIIVSDMLSRNHALRMRQLSTGSPPIEQTLEKSSDRPQVHRNTLLLNRGDGTYSEIANYAGVATSDWSWTVGFIDVDLDGWEDILVGTGHDYDTLDLDATEKSKALPANERNDPRRVLSLFPPLRTPNVAFRNRGDLTFEEAGAAWGFDAPAVSHSLGFADLDNDGDLDLVVNCLKAPALVYRNDGSAPRVAVSLRGTPPNTRGIGARIKVLGGAVPEQSQELGCGSHYLAGDAPVRVFAAGTLTNELTVEVTWRNERRSVVSGIKPNHLLEVDEASSLPATPHPKPVANPLFTQVSVQPPFIQQDAPYDDFARQPLLPAKFSELGPGVAWFSRGGNAAEELIVGGGRSSKLAVFHQENQDKFTLQSAASPNSLPDDSTAFALWSPGQNSNALLAGIASYESGQTNAIQQLDLPNAKLSPNVAWPNGAASIGPLASADVDGDGDLDVFAGGRLIPGRYPEAASSQILRNDGGRLVPDEVASRSFRNVGQVSGAVFTDLDGDGSPELVLACEWGPVRVFKRQNGPWIESTQAWGLANLEGLWTSVTAGDFDGDGRMDIAAGNTGLNTPYQQVAPGPWSLFYGDLNGNGQIHILEAFQDAGLKQVVPWRQMDVLERALPWLRGKFATHAAFSQATVSQVLASVRGQVHQLVIRHLASTLFLNRGDHFEVRPLPPEAQWAPVFGLAVADFDGDGHEDLFLGQNNYAVRPEEARLDSGRGLLLRGDGQGGFTPVSGADSGIVIYGEQRGCAVSDFDGDGRADLAVAEHAGPVHLYRNQRAHPGLQVRLHGPPANPAGLGAVLRLRFTEGLGPARELHGGGGYWSQDSTRAVLATAQPPQALEVRWPGGRVTQTPLSPNLKSILINTNGASEEQAL